MNCRTANKFLAAFADGELNTKQNLEVLEHVNFCESCAAKVVRVQNMKGSLQRVFEAERAPSGAADRIRGRIQERRGPSDQRAKHLIRLHHFVAPLGMAAAIALVWIGSWFWSRSEPTEAGAVTPIQAQWVSAIRHQHNGCVSLGPAHHSAELGWDPVQIGLVLTKQLHLKVAAPDLSARGFRLHSADKCGIMGIPGAHLVYESIADGRLVSIFTVAPLTMLRPSEPFFICAAESPCVVAWHETGATYVLTGRLNAEELVEIANAVRSQM